MSPDSKGQKVAMWVYQNECSLRSARKGIESVLERNFLQDRGSGAELTRASSLLVL